MDGWLEKPIGWNIVDSLDSSSDLVNENLKEYDQENIIVLAGGLDHHGHCHPWFRDRLEVALGLYQIKPRKIFVLGGGTYHKPPVLNKEHYVLHESTIGAKFLVDNGVSPDHVYREWSSYDTIANGYFSLVNFTLPLDLKNLLVITSDFHMPRSKAIFKWIYDMFYNNCRLQNDRPSLSFLEVNTKYLDSDIISIRSQREKNSLDNLHTLQTKINAWSHFVDWFYHQHKAYNCQFDGPKDNIDKKTKESY